LALAVKEAGMVDVPKKKVGIVSCSGEELPEGTVSRLAALKVLEKLRSDVTVTICLPLFLAGGEGDRAFARVYPTITVDGCELRCAARATEMYSSKPAASLVIRDLVAEKGVGQPEGRRRLNPAGRHAVDVAAERMASLVDELLGKHSDRQGGVSADRQAVSAAAETEEAGKVATCSCGSGIPVQKVHIDGQDVTLVALPLIFEQFRESGKPPSAATARELLDAVRVYNPVPDGGDEQYGAVLLREYVAFCEKESVQ
jgi:uncharacterized metal-binding protein